MASLLDFQVPAIPCASQGNWVAGENEEAVNCYS